MGRDGEVTGQLGAGQLDILKITCLRKLKDEFKGKWYGRCRMSLESETGCTSRLGGWVC